MKHAGAMSGFMAQVLWKYRVVAIRVMMVCCASSGIDGVL
jgi:hypothetical protein